MKRIIEIAKSKTSKNILINTVGNYFGVFTTIIYFLALARTFSKPDMAIYSVLFAIANVLANFFDLGVNASVYATIPHIIHDRKQTISFIKSNLVFQTSIAIAVLFICWLFIPFVNTDLLHLNTSYINYFWTFVSVIFFMWQNTFLNVLFASERFLFANIAQTLANILKIVLILVIIYLGKLTVTNTIIVLGIVGQMIFIFCVIWRREKLFREFMAIPVSREHIKARFMGTYFLATQTFTLASRLDLFMIAHYLPLAQVGEYSIAQKIILNIITTVNSITQVVSPQFAKVIKRVEVVRLLKHSLLYILVPAFIFAAAALTPDIIYILVLSEKWINAIPVTRALSVVYIFYTLLSIPLLFFLYTIKKPVYILIINIIFLTIMATGNFLLIPKYGVFGPAVAMGVAMVVVTLFTFGAIKKEIGKLESIKI